MVIMRVKLWFGMAIRLMTYTLYRFIWFLMERLLLSSARQIDEDKAKGRCEVRKIIFRMHFHLTAFGASPKDFMTVHDSFMNPRVVLQPNVTLYCLTPTIAVFVESDKNLNVHHSDVHPFFTSAQFYSAKKLITIPMATFHELAEELGDPEQKLVVMATSMRAGSTMMTQVFENIPGCVGICQPVALEHCMNLNDNWETLRDAFRILCKFDNRSVTMICLKLSVSSNSCLEPLMKMFPNMQGIFLYRNVATSVTSVFTKIFEDPSIVIARNALESPILRIHPCLRNDVGEMFGVGINEVTTFLEIFVSRWIRSMCIARDLMHSLSNRFLIIKYELMMGNLNEQVITVLRFAEIPEKFWAQAMTALKKDSQRGMILSRSVKTSTNKLSLSEINVKTPNALLRRQGFNDFWDDYTLEKPP